MKNMVIIGLGNPDPELEGTYHNAGMLAVDRLAEHAAKESGTNEAPAFRAYKDLFTYAAIGEQTFVKPLVYMNDSGRAAKEALRVLKAKPEDLIVAHGESDIALGEFKITRAGRAAGHKGIQSIIDHLKTDDFTRIRIGIREPNEEHRKKAGDFVLSPISKKNMATLTAVFDQISAKLGE